MTYQISGSMDVAEEKLINFEENDELIKAVDQIIDERPDLFKKLSKL